MVAVVTEVASIWPVLLALKAYDDGYRCIEANGLLEEICRLLFP